MLPAFRIRQWPIPDTIRSRYEPFHAADPVRPADRILPRLSAAQVKQELRIRVEDDGGRPTRLAALALQDAASLVARRAGYDVHGVGRLSTSDGEGGVATASGGLAEQYPGMVWMARSMAADIEAGVKRLRREPLDAWSARDRKEFTDLTSLLVHEASHTVKGTGAGRRSVGPIGLGVAGTGGKSWDVPNFEEPLTELVTYATTAEFLNGTFGVPIDDARRAVEELRAARVADASLPWPYAGGVQALDDVLARVEPDAAARGELARHLAERVPPGWRMDDLTKRVLRAEGVQRADAETRVEVATVMRERLNGRASDAEFDRALAEARRAQARAAGD